MEGHQQDSQTDIKNKQMKKHIRKRTCDRILTEAITHELRRLSGLNDCSGTSQHEHDNIALDNMINEVCMNHVIMSQNNIPSSIVSLSKLKKNMGNGSQSKIEQEIYQNLIKHDKSSILRTPGEKKIWNSFTDYENEEYCNYSGIEVIAFSEVAKCLYETSLQLQRFKKKPIPANIVKPNYTIIRNVELDDLRNILDPMLKLDNTINFDINYGKEQNRPDTTMSVTDERYTMEFVVHLNQIKDFLRVIPTFYSISKINFEVNNNVPCPIQSWHFRNINHGYLLGLLLKNMHVNSLNTMRKLYFVIITRSTVHAMVKITIKLRSGVFTVYDNSCMFYEPLHLNGLYKLLITKSKSMTGLENVIQNQLKRQRNQLRIMLCSKPQQSHSSIDIEASLQRTESIIDSYYENDVSDTESVHSNASECSTILLHQSFTFMVNPDEYEILEIKPTTTPQSLDCGSIINNIFYHNYSIYNSNLLHSKKWLIKLLPGNTCNNLKEKMQLKNIMHILNYDTLKRAIFDQTSTQIKRLESVTDLYWKQVTSQSFYMLFLKSLGHSIANIFFSTVI